MGLWPPTTTATSPACDTESESDKNECEERSNSGCMEIMMTMSNCVRVLVLTLSPCENSIKLFGKSNVLTRSLDLYSYIHFVERLI